MELLLHGGAVCPRVLLSGHCKELTPKGSGISGSGSSAEATKPGQGTLLPFQIRDPPRQPTRHPTIPLGTPKPRTPPLPVHGGFPILLFMLP